MNIQVVHLPNFFKIFSNFIFKKLQYGDFDEISQSEADYGFVNDEGKPIEKAKGAIIDKTLELPPQISISEESLKKTVTEENTIKIKILSGRHMLKQ